MTLTADLSTSTSFNLGPARALSCREVRPRDAAGRRVRLHRVLRPAGGRLRLRRRHPRLHRGGPEVDLALPPPAARAHRRRRAPQHRARPHPADQGRPPRQGAGHPQPLGQGRHRQPDALVQGPGRRRGPRRRPRAGLPGAVLPVHRQPGQRRRRRGRPRGLGFRGAHPVVARAGQGADDRGVRRHAARRRRQLRRRQPARHRSSRPSTRTGRSSTSTSARTTPRAPRRWATRSPSSSAGGCRSRSSCRWRRGRSSPRSTRGSRSSASSGSSRPRRTRCSARRPPAARRWRRRSRRATT